MGVDNVCSTINDYHQSILEDYYQSILDNISGGVQIYYGHH